MNYFELAHRRGYVTDHCIAEWSSAPVTSATEADSVSNARYTEMLTTALVPTWSAARRIEWRGSETYRFVNHQCKRRVLLEAHCDIFADDPPRSGNLHAHAATYIGASQVSRVAARTRYHITVALKRALAFGKPAAC